MTISDDKVQWNRFESFLYTLPKYYYFSLVLTGIKNKSNSVFYRDEKLENKIKSEKFFLKSHNVFFSSHHYKTHPPARWYVEAKTKNCIFIDSDVFICSNLDELEQNNDCLCGVIAHDCPFNLSEWHELFNLFNVKFPEETFLTLKTKKVCPFYINFGFVLITETIKKKIRGRFNFYINKLGTIEKYKNNFFLAQIALTLTVCELEVKTKCLPLRYNFPDYKNHDNLFSEEFDNIKIFHYFNDKLNFLNIKELKDYKKNLTIKQSNVLEPILKNIITKKFKYIL
jgi:hypothetical protein